MTLRFYRSTDATITTADTEVGTGAVAALAASASASDSVSLTAPATPGAYYYGACVDPVTAESDTTNNCSEAVQVNVPAAVPAVPPMQAQPDLVVADPSVSGSDPAAGALFTLSVTARNDGDAAAAATTLRFYRSTDATITTSDTEVATDEVAALAASGSSSESIDVTRAGDRRDVLLRGVRGRGDGGVGHHQQLLVIRAGDGIGTGLGGGGTHGER